MVVYISVLFIISMLPFFDTTAIQVEAAISGSFVFGNTEIGILTNYFTIDRDANKFQLTQNGILQTITVYFTNTGFNAKTAIYTDSNGVPSTLIAQSNSQAITSIGWQTFTLPQTPLTPGYYWLCTVSNSPSYGAMTPTSTNQHAWKYTPYSGEYPTTFGIPTGSQNTATSIYATCTTTTTSNPTPTPTPMQTLHVYGNLIKNSADQTVVLRGVNINEMADDPDGAWLGNWDVWNDNNVKTELSGIASNGMNCIRALQNVQDWVYNVGPTSPQPGHAHCSISNRDAVDRLLTFAAELDIYVIYTPYCVLDYYSGDGGQNSLPYPPYLDSAESQVIPNSQAFVNYWASVALALKNHPNAIFELWNEPAGDATAKTSWFNVAQQCITAIRGTGAQNIIIFQWGYGVYANLDYNSGINLQWILDSPLSDPTGNLVYSTHMYRQWGAFQHWTGGVETYAYSKTDIQQAFNFFKIPQVAALHPVIIGEIGCYNGLTSTEQQNEYTAYTNVLQLANQYGLSYCGWTWRTNVEFPLISDYTPTLTPGGEILKSAINAALNP
jgi:hypothetical protein